MKTRIMLFCCMAAALLLACSNDKSDGEGNIVWEYRRVWSEKKYLRPIPLTAITRNPNLEQNALWK